MKSKAKSDNRKRQNADMRAAAAVRHAELCDRAERLLVRRLINNPAGLVTACNVSDDAATKAMEALVTQGRAEKALLGDPSLPKEYLYRAAGPRTGSFSTDFGTS